MIKQLTSYLDYSIFAELSVLIFAAIFVAVVVRTLMIRNEETNKQSRIVFDDQQETPS